MSRSKRVPKKAKAPAKLEAPKRDPRPLPDWFAPPDPGLVADFDTKHSSQSSTVSAYQVVVDLDRGRFALPPWQRQDVWTREQRIQMLDTMIDQLPLPPIILWMPRERDGIDHLPLAGLPVNFDGLSRTAIVIDGRQRLTTLAMAARGELGVRWNGREWTDGRGFMDAPTALDMHKSADLMLDARDQGLDIDSAMILAAVGHRMHYYKFTFTVFEDYSADEMVEAYRRLVTRGTPHSTADLHAMEAWVAAR